MVFLVSGGMSEGARPFPLKIFDTKISVNSTSGECISFFRFKLYLKCNIEEKDKTREIKKKNIFFLK